uniref:CSON012894 protein n=1 Tax=Culicoides sonorensis TaxID=179676 RepID=A0A336KL30_CULSO
MKGYSIIIAFVIVLSIKSIKMSSIRTTEPPLYDNYDDDYFDKNSDETENPDDEEMLSNRIRLQSTSIPDVTSQNDPTTIITTTEEPAIILSAGLSQIYSIHNKNPNKDKKLMKLLQENAGEAEPPLNCTPFKMLGSQPALLPVVTVPKCCNVGENYYFNETEKGCGAARTEFKFDLIHAVFYEGCIEDQEMNLTYIIEQKPPCAGGILYNENYGDFLYVLSNGSLLRVTEDWEFYDIINEYCLDMTYDNDEFVLSAISCHDVYGGVVHVSQIQGTL